MNTKNLNDIIKKLKNKQRETEKVISDNSKYFSDVVERKFYQTDCFELKNLKVAAVMDEFTLVNFRDECNLLEVTPDNWATQLREFKPDMFFLESAWQGKDQLWHGKIANGSKELDDMTTYCHDNNIPVVFWNKEDPVHTKAFMFAASCADYVFTTDADCIEKYKRTLRHNNVYFLPFSAQPRLHNPVEIHDRKDKFCFAGTYNHRYVDRCRVFDSFADVFEQGKGLDIYDRNLGSDRPEHMFPDRYDKMIMGSLKADDIHIAYKGYNYGVNMNSAGQSQTMFARRVYELLASNTVSVGNYARGCKNLFGDLTVCTDSAQTMKKQLDKYCSNETDYRKYRLLGLRKVMEKNLCEDRMGFIVKCVFGKDMRHPLLDVYILSNARGEDARRVKQSFDRQTWPKKHLVFVNEESISLPQDAFVGVMSPDDYYGENYLKDLILSVRYSDADGFGKVNYYSNTENGIILNGRESTYRDCKELAVSRGIFKSSVVNAPEAFVQTDTLQGDFFCIDEFNYCSNLKADTCSPVDDIYVADRGIEVETINEKIKSVHYIEFHSDITYLSPETMLDIYSVRGKGVSAAVKDDKFVISSELGDDEVVYLDFYEKYFLDDLLQGDTFYAFFSSSGDLDAENFCLLYDDAMNELVRCNSKGSGVLSAQVPDNAKYVRLSLRIKGRGTTEIASLAVGNFLSATGDTPHLLRSDTLIMSDDYPSYDNPCKYPAVHKRNLLYKENGFVPDVLVVNADNENSYREFDNINIIDGSYERIESILSSGGIKSLCVYFLNPSMWRGIKKYLDNISLIVRFDGIAETNSDFDFSECKQMWDEAVDYSEKHDIRFMFDSKSAKRQFEKTYDVDIEEKEGIITCDNETEFMQNFLAGK